MEANNISQEVSLSFGISGKKAKYLDENYIEKGKNLNQSEWERLFGYFRLIEDHQHLDEDFDKSVLYPRCFSFTGFDKLLTRKARKIYNTKVNNTVYEYNDYGKFNWLMRVLKPQLMSEFYHPMLVIEQFKTKNPITYLRSKLYRFLQKNILKTRKSALVQYFGKTIEIGTEENFGIYIKRFAAAFNDMVDREIIGHGTLMPLMIMPLEKEEGEPDRVMLLVYSVNKSEIHYRDINKEMGNNIANTEGSCPDMDWRNIEYGLKLK